MKLWLIWVSLNKKNNLRILHDMLVNSFESICIWSENPDELATWYEQMLELELDEKIDIPGDYGYSYNIAGVWLFIGFHSEVKNVSKDPYRIMPGFVVDSVESIYKKLKNKGVEFILPASPSPDEEYFVATAKDPEGNIIQFFSDNP